MNTGGSCNNSALIANFYEIYESDHIFLFTLSQESNTLQNLSRHPGVKQFFLALHGKKILHHRLFIVNITVQLHASKMRFSVENKQHVNNSVLPMFLRSNNQWES